MHDEQPCLHDDNDDDDDDDEDNYFEAEDEEVDGEEDKDDKQDGAAHKLTSIINHKQSWGQFELVQLRFALAEIINQATNSGTRARVYTVHNRHNDKSSCNFLDQVRLTSNHD